MENHTIQQLQQKANKISRIRTDMRPKRLRLYGWSVAGNTCSLLASATSGGSSDILSSVLYLGKYAVLLFILQPLQKEIKSSEDEIDQTFHEAREIAEQNNQVNAWFLNNVSSFRCSSLVLFVLDLVQRCYGSTKSKPVDVTENTNRLFRCINTVGKAIEHKKLEIEHLPPMLQNIKAAFEDIDKKTVAVVKAIPNVKLPANKPISKSLLDKEIKVKSKFAFPDPERHKKYPEFSRKIEAARKHKTEFQRHAFDILKTARKCLQASEEATTLPTYQLIKDQSKNENFLTEAQKSLKTVEDYEKELEELQFKIKSNPHSVTTHVTKILHATSDAFDNLTQFDVEIKSKLENPKVRETAKKVQRQAENGGHVNKFVNDAVSSMTQANETMHDVEEGSSPFFWGRLFGSSGIKVERILPSEGNSEDWADKGERLAMSVNELAKHAKCIVETPEKIVNGSFKNSKPALVAQTTEIAKEALEISDEIFRVLEQENSSRNSGGQFRALERVFNCVWPACDQTTDLPETTMKMRAEAQKLRLKINEPEKSTGQEWFYRLSYLIHFSAITFDLYKLYTLGSPHPKETLLLSEIERVQKNFQVSGSEEATTD